MGLKRRFLKVKNIGIFTHIKKPSFFKFHNEIRLSKLHHLPQTHQISKMNWGYFENDIPLNYKS